MEGGTSKFDVERSKFDVRQAGRIVAETTSCGDAVLRTLAARKTGNATRDSGPGTLDLIRRVQRNSLVTSRLSPSTLRC